MIRFLIASLLIASPLAAIGGALVNHYLLGAEQGFWSLWRLWWFGDATGLVTLTPLALVFWRSMPGQENRATQLKFNARFFIIAGTGALIWLCVFMVDYQNRHLFIFMPMLILISAIWAALQLKSYQAVIVMALLALATVLVTALGIGPLFLLSQNETALLTQEFVVTFSVVTLLIIAFSSETRRRSEHLKLFENVINSSREGVVVTEAGGDRPIVYCNQAFEALTGYSFSEIRGMNCRFLNEACDENEAARARIRESLQAEKQIEVTLRNKTKSGHEFWNRLSISPIRNDQGEVTHFTGLQLDVSESVEQTLSLERQVADRTQELKVVKERLELATDAAGLGTWEWHLASDELFWDEQMHLIYETPEAVIEQGLFYEFWRKSVHPEDVEQAETSLLAAVENSESWATEFRLLLADGRIKHIKATAEVMYGSDGKPQSMIGGNLEVTNQRLLEDQLRESAKLAETASRAKSEFLANMSHEIRTPMNGVLGIAELLQQTKLSQQQGEYISMIQSSASALLAILNDILDVSKIEAGRLELEPEPTDLDECIGNCVKGFALNAHNKGLELHYRIASNVPEIISVDATRLKQILFNLVGNAIKFTSRGEVRIEVELERMAENHDRNTVANDVESKRLPGEYADARLIITIADTGIGIEPEKKELIFRPFFQADSGINRRFGGTGLGLTIVGQLLGLMGGRLELTSEPGKGTELTVSLPLLASDFDLSTETKTDTDTETETAGHPIDFASLKCLAVDDNEINRRWLNDMLESWGCQVSVAASAKEALALMEAAKPSEHFDIILVDKNMPEDSGFDLVKKVRDHLGLSPIAIIMLSSSELENDVRVSKALGINDYILKPVKRSEVYDAIITAIDQSGQAPVPSSGLGKTQFKPLSVLLAEDNLVNQRLVQDVLEGRGHIVTIAENGEVARNKASTENFDLILMDVQMPIMDGLVATRAIRDAGASEGRAGKEVVYSSYTLYSSYTPCGYCTGLNFLGNKYSPIV